MLGNNTSPRENLSAQAAAEPAIAPSRLLTRGAMVSAQVMDGIIEASRRGGLNAAAVKR